MENENGTNDRYNVVYVKIKINWGLTLLVMGLFGFLISPFYAQYQYYKELEIFQEITGSMGAYYFKAPLSYLLISATFAIIAGIVKLIIFRREI